MQRFVVPSFIVLLSGASGLFAQTKNPVVLMETNHGKIKIELDVKKAPITVANFLKYVEDKHYDGVIFHRIIADFMIQGGGYTPDFELRKSRKPIKNESFNGLSNKRGTIAMARTSEPNSAAAQFFINVKDNLFLDRAKASDKVGYAVFGKVIAGMDVVDKIRKVETNDADRPRENVLIKSVRLLKSKSK